MISCCDKRNMVESSYSRRDEINFGSVKNEKLCFLTLLVDNDYIKNNYCYKYSNEDILLSKKDLFPGILKVMSYKDIELQKEYIIEDIPLPKEIYIKLPKENIYISSDNFQFRYLLSQNNELINIFILLGAKTIKWNIKQENNLDKKININSGINVKGIDFNTGINLDEQKNNTSIFLNELHFSNTKTPLSFDMFKNNENEFYYLPGKYEWQNIIKRRIKRGLQYDKYVYKYNNCYKLNSSLISKLKFLEINFNYDYETYNNLEIEYEIIYYEYEKIEENQISNILPSIEETL